MASFLNQNFDDDEESENEFNPGAGEGSDAGSNRGDSDDGADGIDNKPPTDNRNRRSPDPRRSRNGDSATPPKSNRRRIDDEAEEVQDDDEDENADHGENDEGEGEDLGEDEEEEDDEDEDGIRSRPNKRRKRGLNQFFEEEAEVDDDDDELGDDEEGVGEFVDETHPDDDLPAEADQDDRRHRELDRKRQHEASMDAEKQAQEFKERYGRRTTTALNSGSFVPQNLLMPDVNDPSIWAVRCREGKEKEIISRLMKKLQEAANRRKPMDICSAFERGDGSMKGFIFVEAKQKAAVVEAFDGVPDAYPRSNPKLIPVKEMPDLLRVNKSKELTIDSYVRIRKGLYQGDLGVVEDAAPNGLEATIRLVPRLTYGLDEEEQSRIPQAGVDANGKRKRAFAPPVNIANRPPARFFNENEAKKKHSRFLQPNRALTGKAFSYKGEEYEDGFLIKDFKIQLLITDNVQPKLEETQRFTRTGQDGAETLDLETLKKSLHDNANAESSYQVGDEVEVFSGEQRGIIGRTERVAGGIVSLKVSEGDLSGQVVEVPVKALRKRFREGDNVVVVGGSKYRDQVGTVLMIQDDKVTILPQDSQNELTVFSKDLREASGVGGSSERSKFDVRDLVQLTATTFGCVVGADPQTVRIMNQQGSIETRLPSSISKIEESRNAVAVDKNGSEIRPGDSVREAGGEGKSGSILHLYRGYLFAHDRMRMVDNAGIWVARCTNVISRGGASRNGAPTTDLTKMNPAMLMKGPNGNMAPPQRPGMDRLIKKKVKIIRGPYKGHRGIVKDTTANNEARIELESKNKVVNIPKEQLSILDPNTDTATRYSEWISMRGGPRVMQTGFGGAPTSRIPNGGRTPMAGGDGGRTPAWGAAGGRTPAWGGVGETSLSSRTPAWKGPSGGQTSYGGAAGNMTSYGGGSRTPAWQSTAKTPYSGDSGFSNTGQSAFDAFAAGAQTPAYGAASARTPAWGGPGEVASAPTPAARGYDAPTPAASAPTPGANRDDYYTPAYNAPTPGAFHDTRDAPTPGFAPLPRFAKGANSDALKFNRLDAPTPAASAPTPFASGAYDAPTPAAGGPRYVEDDDDE